MLSEGVEIRAGELITHRGDINAENPPKLSDAGSEVGVDLIIPQALLDGLPAANKIQVKSPVEGSTTPSTTYWWRLDNLLADKDGNPINGWLAEQDLITTRHSPWEWQDFQWVEDTGTPLEKLAYNFNAKGMLSAEEKQNYRAQISKADGGPIVALARLYDIVDTDNDGVLTSKEMRAALAKPWHAQVLGQLIVKYESEWHWNKAKWDELDPLLADENGQKNQTWEIEKQRIEKLSWWRNINLSSNANIWHLKDLALINNFYANDCTCTKKLTKDQLRAIAPKASPSKVDKYIESINEMFDKFKIEACISMGACTGANATRKRKHEFRHRGHRQ